MRRKITKGSLLTGLALVLLLSACTKEKAGENAAAAEPAVKEIIVADTSEDGSMDPASLAIQTWVSYSKLCSAPLLSYNDKGEEVMEAATAYTVSDDQLTWTFSLRKEGKWSDGSAVTAADFINTIERALDPDNSYSIYAEMLYNIAGAQGVHKGTGSLADLGVVALDDYTLQFRFLTPCPYFTKMISLPVFYPTKKGVATAENPNWMKDPSTSLGNGAYRMTEYVQDQYYVVEKNPYYYDADKVNIEKITTKFISDSQARIAAYESGEIDYVAGLPDYIEAKYAGKPDLAIWHMLTTTVILPNIDVKPLDDPRVRAALSLGLSRDAICKALGSNYEASYSWVPKYMMSNAGSEYYSQEVEPLFAENREKARSLLAEAGYPEGKGFPVLTYIYPSSDKDALLAQAVQAQLKESLGIGIELQAQESQVYNATKRDGSFELLRFSWTADFNDPINYLSLYTSESSLNFGNVNDPDYDKAIELSNFEMDPAKRNAYLHDASRTLIGDNFYTIPMTTMKYIGLRNPRITGISYNDKGEPYYRFADVN